MPETTENHDLITAAREGIAPTNIREGVWIAHNEMKVVDLRSTIESDADRPRRKRGTVTVSDVTSFADYFSKHSVPATEVWADLDASTVTAVLNAHEESALAGWCDHRAVLALTLTADWREWTDGDQKWFSQGDFAEFVEKHLPNFVGPAGAVVLDLAQDFRATKNVRFDASRRVKSGQTQITWHEDIEARAGAKGALDIPDTLTLALQVYEFSVVVGVTARLRYRIDDGSLRLGYLLDRPCDVVRDAFEQVVADTATATGWAIWNGRPS